MEPARLSASVAALVRAGELGDETPAVLVHDLDLLAARITRLRERFPASALHAVAIKANPVLAILSEVVAAGCGLEAASWEEVELARAAGCDAGRIVFDSPAKTRVDLQRALALGVRINVDNLDELARVAALAPGDDARIGLRFNPAVGAGAIASTSVADRDARFGVPWPGSADAFVPIFAAHPWLSGLHVHIGSQGHPIDRLLVAARRVADVRRAVDAALGTGRIRVVDIGGGLPTWYGFGDPPAGFDAWVDGLSAQAPELFADDVQIVTELGRALQTGCGVALSRVEYVKQVGDRMLAVIHVGADLLPRTAYAPNDWPHEILVLDRDGQPKTGSHAPWTIAGPLCFAGDVVARDRSLPPLEPGDLIAIRDVGGYTMGMWSRHCSRGMPPVIGLRGDPPQLVPLRRRETPSDIVTFWRG